MTYKYQGNPLLAARQAHAEELERNQKLTELLTEARQTIRQLRAEKIRLQARNANLKKYRPHAPSEHTAPADEAEARLRAAVTEVASWHRKRRVA